MDALVRKVVGAPDRVSLVAAVRALDRVLLYGYYVIPQWHISGDRLAFWDKFGRPNVTPIQGYQFDAWWVDPKKDASLERRKASFATEEQAAEEGAEGKPAAGKAISRAGTSWAWAAAAGIAALLALWALMRRRRKP